MKTLPRTFPALVEAARELARLRRFDEAARVIDLVGLNLPRERDKVLLLKLDIALAAKDDAMRIGAERSLGALVDAQPDALLRVVASLRLRKRTQAAWTILSRVEPAPALAPEAFLLGMAFAAEGDAVRARTCYEFALEANPALAEAHVNLGDLFLRTRDFLRAQPHFEAALAVDRGQAAAWLGLAQCQLNTGQGAAALQSLSRVPAELAATPMLLAWRASALQQTGDDNAAATLYEQALAADPALFPALFGSAQLCERRGQLDVAAQRYDRAYAAQSTSVWSLANLVYCLRRMADWPALAAPEAALIEHLRAGNVADYGSASWVSLDLPGTTLRQIAAAFARSQAALRVRATPQREFVGSANPRLRVAYLSSDFRAHATARLVVETLECHDRARVEVFAFALAPFDDSAPARRIAAAVEHVVDVAGLPAEQVAARLLDARIDVLVDLNGHTQGECAGLLALRPAPIVVNWLGYPGSMGDYTDYILGDAQLTPPQSAAEFSEAIVRLPGSYQPNDARREVGADTTRAAQGLPADAIVACSFNQAWKFTEAVFAIWLRLAAAQPRLVLWLLEENPWFQANLQARARAAGIDPARIVFAPRVGYADHLARLALADLALDTVPCNSHTTGSDALWMGVPLVTLTGDALIGRVGASLLHAVGLPELVTHTPAQYEALLLDLVVAPEKLAELHIRLVAARATAPLFDSRAKARALEAAYAAMVARHRRGLAPAAIDIDANAMG